MASTLTQPFASAGFSVQRTEITSVMQPTYAEYFVSDGSTRHLPLKRLPDLGLADVASVRIFVNEFNELAIRLGRILLITSTILLKISRPYQVTASIQMIRRLLPGLGGGRGDALPLWGMKKGLIPKQD